MADPVVGHLDAAWVIRMGGWGTRVLGLVLVLALVFTMVNVQQFAAADHPVRSFEWWISWLLDPMASITMGTAIVFEGLLAGYGRRVGWLTATKWYAGIATWAMNIWVSLIGVVPSGVLLHSVAPGLVLLLAEAAPRVRAHLAEIVHELQEQPGGSARSAESTAADPTPVELPAATDRQVQTARPTAAAPSPRQPESAVTAPVSGPTRAPPLPDDTEPGAGQRPVTPASVTAPERDEPSQVPTPVSPVAAGDEDLIERVRQLVTESTAAGRPLGRRALAKQLDTSEHRVRVALDLVGATTGPALNGTSGSAQDAGSQPGNR